VGAVPRAAVASGTDFVLDKGACLLAKAGRQVFYAGYETWIPPLRGGICDGKVIGWRTG
jgi:hypothetical protein